MHARETAGADSMSVYTYIYIFIYCIHTHIYIYIYCTYIHPCTYMLQKLNLKYVLHTNVRIRMFVYIKGDVDIKETDIGIDIDGSIHI